MADVLNPLAVKTKANGDVKIDLSEYNDAAVGASNAIHVQPGTGASFTVANAGTFVVQDNQVTTDNGSFTDGSTKLFTAGYIFDESAGTALTENDAAAARVDAKRAVVFALEDATTRGQRAAVDASGRLSVSLTASSATVTADTELPAAAALSDTTGNPTAPMVGGAVMVWDGSNWVRGKQIAAAFDVAGTGIMAVGITGQFDDSSTATVTENQFAPVRISSRRAMLVEGVASGTNVNVALAASSATVTVDSELPAAAALSDTTANPTTAMVGGALMLWDGSTNWVRGKTAATLADALANPGVGLVQSQDFLMGYNGSTWDRVRTANTGRLQVDVITGGGTDTPTNPVMDPKTSASLAAGGSVDLDSTDVGTVTKKLTQLILWSTVPFKAVLKTVSNGSATIVAYMGGAAQRTVVWDSPHRNYVTQGDTGAGFCGFRVSFTNLDNSDSADVYATYVTQE